MVEGRSPRAHVIESVFGFATVITSRRAKIHFQVEIK
jgi:hypothetical protein